MKRIFTFSLSILFSLFLLTLSFLFLLPQKTSAAGSTPTTCASYYPTGIDGCDQPSSCNYGNAGELDCGTGRVCCLPPTCSQIPGSLGCIDTSSCNSPDLSMAAPDCTATTCCVAPPAVACTNPNAPNCRDSSGNEVQGQQGNCCTGFTCVPGSVGSAPTPDQCVNANNACITSTNPPTEPLSCITPNQTSNCCSGFTCIAQPAGLTGPGGNVCENTSNACVNGENPGTCSPTGQRGNCCAGYVCNQGDVTTGGQSFCGPSAAGDCSASPAVNPNPCTLGAASGATGGCCKGYICANGGVTSGGTNQCGPAIDCYICPAGSLWSPASDPMGCVNQTSGASVEATSRTTCDSSHLCNQGQGCISAVTPTPPPPPCSKKSADGTQCLSVDSGVGISLATDPGGLINTLVAIVLSVAGAIALLLIIISGYRLMVSQGNPENVKNAREQLTAAIIGLLFVIFSLVILQLIGVNILGLPGFSP